MKTKLTLQLLILLPLLAHITQPLTTRAQGTTFTYQGRLNDGANTASGDYDLRFAVFDTPSAGVQQGNAITNPAIAVSNGFFTVALDFGNVFSGADRFLEIGVRTNGSGGFTTLSPRQKITATPYAITASDVTGTSVARLNISNTTVQATGHPIVTSGFITSAVIDNGGSGYLTAPSVAVNDATGSGASITATVSNGSIVSLIVNNAGLNYSAGATLTIGAPPSNAYQIFNSTNYFGSVNFLTNGNNIFVGNGAALTGLWRLAGNAGTTAGSQFLGTTDNQPLELKVNNQRALRIKPETQSRATITAGSPFNTVNPVALGATICGGGATNAVQTAYSVLSGLTTFISTIPPAGSSNQIASDFATIAGGVGNFIDVQSANAAIGGGVGNQIGAYAGSSVIAGGCLNLIQTSNSYLSVISGGVSNLIGAAANASVIAGGQQNTIQAGTPGGTVGGGLLNTAAGDFATVPGGDRNSATNHAFAAGHRAKANHDGAFVWADSTDADFATTAANQFLIRASGGVGIGTASPVTDLHVNGTTVIQGGFAPTANTASNLLNLAVGVNTNGSLNGISFYETAGALAMSLGYDGSGGAAQNALRIYSGTGSPLFTFEASGELGIGITSPTNRLHVNGGVSATAFVNTSDRNAKENFAPVSPTDVLAKVASLPITTWNFKTMNDGRHMGPMAQDFYAAFGLGGGDTTITSVDPDGVALAAIQGLNQKVEAKDAEIRFLKSELEQLKKVVNKLANANE